MAYMVRAIAHKQIHTGTREREREEYVEEGNKRGCMIANDTRGD
jgi:hypothetical protein